MLKECKEKYKIKNVSKDYKDVINSDIDAVSICTSNETHFEIAKAALDAGKHVLVEKPITLKSKEAYKLVEIARKRNKVLAVGHIFRYNNAINEVKKLVERKFFGNIWYLRFQWTIRWMSEIYPDKQLDIIVDMMPHIYDMINHITNLWPKKINCFAKAYIKKDLEDTAYIISELPNNILVHTEISWTLPEKVREIDLIGSKAAAKIQAISQEVKIFKNSNEGEKLEVEPNNTLGDELKQFIQSIRTGIPLPNNGEIGAKVVEYVEATKKSLKEGKAVIV